MCLTPDEVAGVINGALTEGPCGRSDYDRCLRLEERFRKVICRFFAFVFYYL